MAAQDIVIGTELGNEFLLGTETPNKITIAVDGTSVTKVGDVLGSPGPVWDNTARTLTFPSVNGAPAQVVNLAAVDIFVDGGSFDPLTSILTLTDTNGTTPDVTVDLSNLLGVSTDAGNLLTNGTDGKALFTKANLDAQTSICESVFGTQLFRGVNI